MTTVEVKVTGSEELQRFLARISPRKRPQIWRDILGGIGGVIERIAKRENMILGGKGPPHPTKLTSRTGIGRRSIAMDQSDLPRSVTVGSDRVYMALHETGGRVSIPRHRVRSHTRTVAFGRRVAPFEVPEHQRGPYAASYPPRPWLEPAINRARLQSDAIMLRALQKAAKG